ncbi:hypothetical protein HYC85_014410 [Camellia sinensis]|uniref:Uncharacterized protein n=1 Tax=Camellia sinensis TaxID=4442 RepID=A0A7J7H643_CAMSI|nr:hypothetical protein HYC85_014410 [Camellia sinensis]
MCELQRLYYRVFMSVCCPHYATVANAVVVAIIISNTSLFLVQCCEAPTPFSSANDSNATSHCPSSPSIPSLFRKLQWEVMKLGLHQLGFDWEFIALHALSLMLRLDGGIW